MSGYVVKTYGGVYVCSTHRTTVGAAVINYCTNENDAHQFEKAGAAEAVAFLVGGDAYWYDGSLA